MTCNHVDCDRRARSRGYCTTHYRRLMAGKPMDDPIRPYKRRRPRRRRRPPFAKELELLRELGLR
jgi:hypothetical protein